MKISIRGKQGTNKSRLAVDIQTMIAEKYGVKLAIIDVEKSVMKEENIQDNNDCILVIQTKD